MARQPIHMQHFHYRTQKADPAEIELRCSRIPNDPHSKAQIIWNFGYINDPIRNMRTKTSC